MPEFMDRKIERVREISTETVYGSDVETPTVNTTLWEATRDLTSKTIMEEDAEEAEHEVEVSQNRESL
jgi:head-tail adaptor